MHRSCVVLAKLLVDVASSDPVCILRLFCVATGPLCLGKSVDLTREAFSAEKFDVALDKACLDSIVCSTQVRTDNYLQQIDR